jgi:integrase
LSGAVSANCAASGGQVRPDDQNDGDASTPPLNQAVQTDQRQLSARSLHFYARDWAEFGAWCRGAGAVPLPASAATLAAYLTDASQRLSPGAVARRLAAIADQHRQAGLVAPTKDPDVKTVLRAMRRAASPRRDPPPSPALLARMIEGCPGDLAGLRDRALLLMMMATRLGRAALVSLDAENIRTNATGCALRVDDAGAWRAIQLARSPERGKCPVQALDEWLLVSETSFGPVFRKIDRWDNIEHHRLGADAVRRILARRAPGRPKRTSRRHDAAHDQARPA